MRQKNLLDWAEDIGKAIDKIPTDIFIAINNLDGPGLRYLLFLWLEKTMFFMIKYDVFHSTLYSLFCLVVIFFFLFRKTKV